ncbi:LuxR C-terminal-related transcriptional regulator [Streptomyces niveiscabiei]|uniref:helix-turn-helix transcriptional regulator n=1 Tax=Streptomyces niveiscabiei TaxID=164115 RepID=UPI0029ADC2D2|nr:LuxR C-terminal-related transcriptional regulator [Streptomyces niveiscabiei]MDX3386059.1 LuxR C-terminal-related transcriptional regulator [Streptomyces niveiscabiei]
MTTVPVPAPGEPPVAREAELARFAGIVDALANGRGTVVEITGEPGIGKTRLALALMRMAARRGLPAVRVQVVRGEAVPVGRRSGLLVLDDVHWCDPASTAALVRQVRAGTLGPFVLALVHRPRQTAPELLQALDDGVRAGTVKRVEPSPLGDEAVAALLDAWQVDAGLARELGAEAGGNPRHLRLLVARGRRPGRPGDAEGLLREAKPLFAELDGVTGDAATALSAAAVLGSPFRPQDVARVCGLDLDATLDALGELERADLIRAHGGSLRFRHPVLGDVVHARAGLSFRLRAHRRALDIAGNAVERARHAEHLLGTDPAVAVRALSEGATEVAAREPGTAARWLRLALEALPELGTGAEAVGRTRLPEPDPGAEAVGRARLPEPDPGAGAVSGARLPGAAEPATMADMSAPSSRTALELACCRALVAAEQPEEARTRAHALLAAPSAHLSPRETLQAYTVCADAERQLGHYQEAMAVVGAALALLPRPLPEPLPPEAVRLAIEFGLVHAVRGTHDEARGLLEEAVRATGDADEADRTALRVLAALCATHAGDVAEATAEVAHCARVLDAMPDPFAGRTPETLALLGCAELYLERFTDAIRHLGREAETRVPVLMHRLLALTMAEQWTGRLDASERRAREAETLARSLGAQDAVTLARAMRATALVWSRGRREAAEAVALLAETTAALRPGQSWWTVSATGLLAQAQFLTGDAAGCRRTLLDRVGGERLPLVRPFWRPFLLALLAAATLECGDRDGAHRLLRHAESASDGLGLPVQEAYVQEARARLHAADGEYEAAAKLFDLAAHAFRCADMPVQYAWTLTAAARALAETEGHPAALRHLELAEGIARVHGARLVHEEAARLRAELPASDPLAHLTDREREVADLAASGLRTREIAERLFLSPRTIETHLAHVYRKLDVTSRLALSAALRRAR